MKVDIKSIQNYELKITKDIVEVLEKNNLRYFLSFGSMLGAVRHKGFIPWDDDLDIQMPIEDYNKFLKIAEKELPEYLVLQTYYNQPGCPNLFAMIRADGTTAMPVNAQKLDIHWGIEVDIFPTIGLYDNKILKSIQKKALKLCSEILCIEYWKYSEPEKIEKKKSRKLFSKLPVKIRILFCKIITFLFYKKTNNSSRAAYIFRGVGKEFDSKAIEKVIKVDFEDTSFNIPERYDELLTLWYGDYMTPPDENERKGHELTMGEIIFDDKKDYREYKNSLNYN